jgi:hypothetical protein
MLCGANRPQHHDTSTDSIALQKEPLTSEEIEALVVQLNEIEVGVNCHAAWRRAVLLNAGLFRRL